MDLDGLIGLGFFWHQCKLIFSLTFICDQINDTYSLNVPNNIHCHLADLVHASRYRNQIWMN